MWDYIKLVIIFVKAFVGKFFKSEYVLSFVKEEDEKWYADIKGWPKKFHANAEMVFGADKFLDYLDDDDIGKVTLKIITHWDSTGIILSRVRKVWNNGAFYDVRSSDFLDLVYICPVTLFFLGKYPEYITIKKI